MFWPSPVGALGAWPPPPVEPVEGATEVGVWATVWSLEPWSVTAPPVIGAKADVIAFELLLVEPFAGVKTGVGMTSVGVGAGVGVGDDVPDEDDVPDDVEAAVMV